MSNENLPTILPATCPEYDAAKALPYELRDEALANLTPVVGMPASVSGYSDRMAVTVIAVSKSGNRITVRGDKAKLLNAVDSGEADALTFTPGGFCGHTEGAQRYAYTSNPEGGVSHFSKRVVPCGRGRTRVIWVQVGRTARGGARLTLGIRSEHYDFNF